MALDPGRLFLSPHPWPPLCPALINLADLSQPPQSIRELHSVDYG
jgi:hypothetical protein